MKPEQYLRSLPDRTAAKERVWDNPLWTTANDALRYPHLQPNSPVMQFWLLFDMDQPDSWLRIEASRLPVPTYIAVNKENGHAHVGYLFESPVCLSQKGREKPINFLHDIERGFRKRMGADPAFAGCLTKNPCHPRWDTDWNAKRPYRLDELNDSLERADKAKATASLENTVIGRNFTIFEAIRKVSYRQVLKYKKDGKSQDEFMEFLIGLAQEINRTLPVQLGFLEIRGIAKSVAKWAWRKFTFEKFSAIQAARSVKGVAKRWEGHIKPWVPLGIPRSTYYWRKAQGTI